MSTVISVENLSKSYLIGHQGPKERYTSLRDTLANGARSLAHRTVGALSGRQMLQGDSIEEFWALKDISFEVKQGEVIGIIGRNGAGKSTLLKVLSRITEPSRGRVTMHGRIASLLEVGTGFHPELTGRENIFLNGAILGMSRKEIKTKFDEIIVFSGVEKFLDTPVKRYSSGMYVRLAFAVAAHLEPEILIVDEVLAVGDAEFQKKCLGKLKDVSGQGRTVLFVSHNMAAMSKLCTTGIYLKAGQVEYIGDMQRAISIYAQGSSGNIEAKVDLQQCNVTRRGLGTIKFTEFIVSDQNHNPSIEIEATTDFYVGFELESKIVERGLMVGFSFVSNDGIELIGSSSHDSGMPTSLPLGRHRFECKISPNQLLPGRYTLRAAIFNNVDIFDHIDDVLSFDIIDVGVNPDSMPSGHRVGYFYIPFEWSKIQ